MFRLVSVYGKSGVLFEHEFPGIRNILVEMKKSSRV